MPCILSPHNSDMAIRVFFDVFKPGEEASDLLNLTVVIIGHVGNADFNIFPYGIQIYKIFKYLLI